MSSLPSITQVVERTKKAEVLALLAQSADSVSLAEIGRRVGLSRERVRALARKAGSVAHKRGKLQEYVCVECGEAFLAWPSRIESGRRFCSLECAYHAHRGPRVERLTFRCEVCGQTYTRKASEAKDGTRFCSKVCQGMWLSNQLPRDRGRFKRLVVAK